MREGEDYRTHTHTMRLSRHLLAGEEGAEAQQTPPKRRARVKMSTKTFFPIFNAISKKENMGGDVMKTGSKTE